LCGTVYKENMRYWVSENSYDVCPRPFHSKKFTVWYAVIPLWNIGTYVFEDEGRRIKENSDRYVRILGDFFNPDL